jgi:hypothetical protein
VAVFVESKLIPAVREEVAVEFVCTADEEEFEEVNEVVVLDLLREDDAVAVVTKLEEIEVVVEVFEVVAAAHLITAVKVVFLEIDTALNEVVLPLSAQ